MKTVLITGASSGFGRDTAETLASKGYRIYASMRGVGEKNRAHAAALRALGIRVIEIDVASEASVTKGVAAVLEDAGGLDVLINNAGIGAAGVTEAFNTDQMHAVFDVNVFGVQRALRAALPTFRAQKAGLVINVGSIYGRLTLPFFGIYSASKFAIEALTQSYNYELSKLGIDVVLVQPSNYPTSVFANAIHPIDGERRDSYGEIGKIPGKMLEGLFEQFKGDFAPDPHEVAEAIAGLIEQPNGTRPLRTVVGQAFGTDVINATVSGVHEQVLANLGLSFLSPEQNRA